jgi:hypothetical protein
MTVTSSSETEEQIRTAIGAPTKDEETSEAAKKLGEKGGKAAAEARQARQKEEAKEAKAKPEKPEAEQLAEADEATEEAESSKKGNPRHDATARVAQATRQAAEERRRREAVEREAASLKQELERAKAPRQEQKPAEDPEPAWEQYEARGKSFQEFLKDFRDHGVRTALQAHEAQRTARERQEAQVRETREFIGTYEQRMNDYAEKNGGEEFLASINPDYTNIPPARVLPQSERKPENYIAEEVIASEHAPELWLHFSEHPEEFQRLATLPPREWFRGIARIEATLNAPKAAATAGNSAARTIEVSKAKPPLQPVRTTASGNESTSLEELSQITDLKQYASAVGFKGKRVGR